MIEKIEKENKELREKISSLEIQVTNYKKQHFLLENDFLNYKEEMLKKDDDKK